MSNGPASQPIDWSVNKGRLAQAEEIIRANTDKFEEFTQKVQQAAKDEHKHTS